MQSNEFIATLSTCPVGEVLARVADYTAQKRRAVAVREEDNRRDAEDIAAVEKWASGFQTLFGQATRKPNVLDRIAAAIEADGPRTYEELYRAMPDLSVSVIYNAVRDQSGKEQGRFRFDKSSRPGVVVANPDYDPNRLDEPYVERILAHDHSLEAGDPVVADAARVFRVYEQEVVWARNGGKRLPANRTWRSVANHGLVEALSLMVIGAETEGFSGLRAIGREDLTAEALVLRHPGRFADAVVEAAHRRVPQAAAA